MCAGRKRNHGSMEPTWQHNNQSWKRCTSTCESVILIFTVINRMNKNKSVFYYYILHYWVLSSLSHLSKKPLQQNTVHCLPNQILISMELDASSTSNGYLFILKGLSLVPIWHYLLTLTTLLTCFLYNFLEIHFLQDLFSGFSCSPAEFSYNSCSQIYDAVVSKCPILQGGYSVTPWLSSPHLQTIFLNFFGNAPSFKYKRSQLLFHIFILSLFLYMHQWI